MFRNFNTDSYNLKDKGLLLLRVGIGLSYMMHGYPKIIGGVNRWTGLGRAMGNIGITFFPAFWGFMAAISEFGGGFLLIIGFFTRVSSSFMAITMLMATIMHLKRGDGFGGYSHALELLIVFAALVFAGGGKYSLDRIIRKSD